MLPEKGDAGPCQAVTLRLMTARTYSGVVRPVKRFSAPWLAAAAAAIESEVGDPFRPYGARLRARPIRISGVFSVGESVSLDLDPDQVEARDWWGDFESYVEVGRRARFSRKWNYRLDDDSVMAWLREESKDYLAQLEAG